MGNQAVGPAGGVGVQAEIPCAIRLWNDAEPNYGGSGGDRYSKAELVVLVGRKPSGAVLHRIADFRVAGSVQTRRVRQAGLPASAAVTHVRRNRLLTPRAGQVIAVGVAG
jgi:hypothetical protein